MTSVEIRQAFLDFFEKKGHTIVPSSSLLSSDPTVLLTTAGMQQFKEYYSGKPSPYGNRVASCQKCFRTSDIEEVGDRSHLTFLEMLGNFSFVASSEASSEGREGYFKKETIEFAFELLTDVYRLPAEDIWITYFRGDKDVPEDKESQKFWQELGIPSDRMFAFDREDNFWGPTGEEGPCGPTTEIHFDLTKKPCSKNCRPNCNCGRFVEVWNLVFNEYYQDKDRKLTFLEKKGVDTGMGFERLVMVVQGRPSIFETDLFDSLLQKITEDTVNSYSQNQKAYRVIADHIKGSVFLAAEGILPSNVEAGYILRRILRRAISFSKLLNLPNNSLIVLAQKSIEAYKDIYPEVKSKETDILTVIQNEGESFEKSRHEREKIAEKLIRKKQHEGTVTGSVVYDIYSTTSIRSDRIGELAREHNIEIIDPEGFFRRAREFQEVSKLGAKKKFGGVGKEATQEAAKLHTATHLLNAALREVLGKHVKQMGSDITSQRLRFDFSHPQKMTPDESKKVENLVNQKIGEKLKVSREEMPYNRAIESGALAFFKEKYPEIVSVYSVGNPKDSSERVFSREICAGPHAANTGELGRIKIVKEESSGAGIRRVRAILEK